jgi:hypothetical protein
MGIKTFTIAILAILILSTNTFSAIDGIGIKDDEYAHIFFSAWVTDVCNNNNFEWWQTGLLVLGSSVAKEVYDTQKTGFSSKDIGFSLSGYTLSSLVSAVIFPKKPKRSDHQNIKHLKINEPTKKKNLFKFWEK